MPPNRKVAAAAESEKNMSVIAGDMQIRRKKRKSLMPWENYLVGDKLRMSYRQQAGGVNVTVSALG